MHEAVPDDVGEPDKTSVVSCDDPSEAVVLDELTPVPLLIAVQPRREGGRMEEVHL